MGSMYVNEYVDMFLSLDILLLYDGLCWCFRGYL